MRSEPPWRGAEAQVRGAAATAAACSLSAHVTEGQAPRGCFSPALCAGREKRYPDLWSGPGMAAREGGRLFGPLCRAAEGAVAPDADRREAASCALRERSGAVRREAHLSLRASRRPCHGVTAPLRASRRPCHGVTAPSAPPAAHVMASRRPLTPRASRLPPPRTRKRPRIAAGPLSDDTPVAYSESVPSSGTDSSGVCSTPEVALTVNVAAESALRVDSAPSSLKTWVPASVPAEGSAVDCTPSL